MPMERCRTNRFQVILLGHIMMAVGLVTMDSQGMGVSTVSAARILRGQNEGGSGEETMLAMDTFPYVAFSKQVADSASTATAYHCGVKANAKTLGLSAKAVAYECNTTFGNEVYSHASPAAAYAHSVSRSWYSDADLPSRGGRMYMTPKGTPDPEYPTSSSRKGNRKDKKNLIDVWLNAKPVGLMSIRLIYYLLFYGPLYILSCAVLRGRIDHGHHDGIANLALTEAEMFDRAIERAAQITRESDTLTVVTADHSHVFTFGGNTPRGNPIFGLAPKNADDEMPFTSILYANGPGYVHVNGTRANISTVDYCITLVFLTFC
ncbi:hypothetical protein GOODEAATRI_007306 [Goodea atripinnis]|uniref:Alkaline phosphatase n=1 Tax=Goodea atripinnis TaxID=208336 RepID=A0ABV0PC59_9TELE